MNVKSLIGTGQTVAISINRKFFENNENWHWPKEVQDALPRNCKFYILFPKKGMPAPKPLLYFVPPNAPCYIGIKTKGKFRAIGTIECQHKDIEERVNSILAAS